MHVKMVGVFRKLISSWTEKGWKLCQWELILKVLYLGVAFSGWRLKPPQSYVRCELQSRLRADPGWLYLQWRYKVCSSPRHVQGGGWVAWWQRAWWGGGELDSGGSINHRSCWFVLTLQSHRAATVNVLAGILRGSMKERAWLNTHLLSWCVRTC